MATKTFLAFGFSAGIGSDNYKSSGDITAKTPAAPTTDDVSLNRSLSRTNWFVDLTLNAGPMKLGFEYGGVGSASIATVNHFDPGAGASRNYASFGIRFGW
jgi:hypothetical protein